MSLKLPKKRDKVLKRGADPSILTHPNIPKPLHGIAPRVIMGDVWWDEQRKEAYRKAGYCCEACGVDKQDAKYHKWLEAHEFYEYDFKRGKIIFKKLVALCHSCHNFIHSGRMKMLVNAGAMEEEKMEDILRHGYALLSSAGLNKETPEEVCQDWGSWRLVFDSKEYGPSTNSFVEWEQGKWRSWRCTK